MRDNAELGFNRYSVYMSGINGQIVEKLTCGGILNAAKIKCC